MIKRIEIECFCQATEDEDKVLRALKALTTAHFKEEKTFGHYGNPIKIYRAEIKNKRGINATLGILNNLEKYSIGEIEKRVDDRGRFYLRLDKQRLVREEVVVDTEGDISVMVKFVTYPLKREKVIDDVQKILGN